MQRTTIKRGATLQYEASVSNDAVPVDLTGWTITSQVRTPYGSLIGAVNATLLNQTTNKGQYRLHADTDTWSIGLQLWDIKYSYDDGLGGEVITYTETVELLIDLAVTGAGP